MKLLKYGLLIALSMMSHSIVAMNALKAKQDAIAREERERAIAQQNDPLKQEATQKINELFKKSGKQEGSVDQWLWVANDHTLWTNNEVRSDPARLAAYARQMLDRLPKDWMGSKDATQYKQVYEVWATQPTKPKLSFSELEAELEKVQPFFKQWRNDYGCKDTPHLRPWCMDRLVERVEQVFANQENITIRKAYFKKVLGYYLTMSISDQLNAVVLNGKMSTLAQQAEEKWIDPNLQKANQWSL